MKFLFFYLSFHLSSHIVGFIIELSNLLSYQLSISGKLLQLPLINGVGNAELCCIIVVVVDSYTDWAERPCGSSIAS